MCDFYSKRAMARHEHLPKELKHLAWLSRDDADGQQIKGRTYYCAKNHSRSFGRMSAGIPGNSSTSLFFETESPAFPRAGE